MLWTAAEAQQGLIDTRGTCSKIALLTPLLGPKGHLTKSHLWNSMHKSWYMNNSLEHFSVQSLLPCADHVILSAHLSHCNEVENALKEHFCQNKGPHIWHIGRWNQSRTSCQASRHTFERHNRIRTCQQFEQALTEEWHAVSQRT